MAGGAARPPALAVLLSAWSMSVRRRSEVWERYRRSPYCHFSLLWQGRADQAGDGVPVGEDLDDVGLALDLPVEALDGIAAAGSSASAPWGGRRRRPDRAGRRRASGRSRGRRPSGLR